MGTEAADRTPLPAKIGRYAVLGYLADGGMAEIFLGRDQHRPVVIKRILPHLARQRNFVSMFIDEARIGSLVHHSNVVEIYELGQVGTDLFMVMEYLAGESVLGLLRRAVARERRLPYALGAHIVAEACAGLHSAHELCDHEGKPFGLVHRDVSLSNLFITYDGDVKVLDFGIATAAHRLTQTSTGQVKGKFSYMSPEQCLGETLDRRSDIFSLGVVLYELTTHRRLFKRANELLVLKGVTEESIPRPTRVRPDYPPALERIVMKALGRHRDMRHVTALGLRNELLALLPSLGPRTDLRASIATHMTDLFPERIAEKQALVRHVRAGTDIGEMPAAEVDEHVEVPQVEPRATESLISEKSRASQASWLVLVLLVVAAGASATWWYMRRDTQPAARTDVVPMAPVAATAPAPEHDMPTTFVIHVASIPSNATVFIDGEQRGATPYELTLDHPRTVTLRLELAGHSAVTQELMVDREQHLLIPMAALPPSPEPAKRKPTAKPRPKPTKDDPFQRFD